MTRTKPVPSPRFLPALLCLSLVILPALHGGNGDREAIEAVMAEFEDAYEARDLDRLMATFVSTDDLALFLPNPYIPMLIDGRKNVREAIDIFLKSIPKHAVFIMTRQQPNVYVYGDIAVDYNYTNIYLLVGGRPFNFLARTTNILRKEDGQWKILHIHGGSVPKMSDYNVHE
jgi:ketosteroid isomerase-like protein